MESPGLIPIIASVVGLRTVCGDYRVAQFARLRSSLQTNAALWILILMVVGVHSCFIKTFPLNNNNTGDTPNYYYLITQFKSNLSHAPGYPFLAGLPFRLPVIGEHLLQHPDAANTALLVGQHAFEIVTLTLLMLFLARTFNRTAAFIAVAIAGLNLDGMAVTSASSPEWLQADLLMLSLVLAGIGWHATPFKWKATSYVLSYWVFTWAYLVKFNTLAFSPVLMLPLLFEKLSWRRRVCVLGLVLTFAAGTYLLFVFAYHRPKTGTRSLSYDHSWILIDRLSLAYGTQQLPYPQGIATKRWLALSALLPPRYDLMSPVPTYDHVNAIPEEVREPYREVANHLLNADEAELDRFISSHPLPEQFDVSRSHFPISYYVGLKVSDNLGTRVFFESIAHRPTPFIQDVARVSWTALMQRPRTYLFPVPDDLDVCDLKITPIDAFHFRLDNGQSRHRLTPQFGYDHPVIWMPGYKFFAAVYKLELPNKVILIVIVFGVIGAIFQARNIGWTYQNTTVIAMTFNLIAYVVFSTTVYAFRWKEARLALPIVGTLIGIICGYILPKCINALRPMATCSNVGNEQPSPRAKDPRS